MTKKIIVVDEPNNAIATALECLLQPDGTAQILVIDDPNEVVKTIDEDLKEVAAVIIVAEAKLELDDPKVVILKHCKKLHKKLNKKVPVIFIANHEIDINTLKVVCDKFEFFKKPVVIPLLVDKIKQLIPK
jgi:DNA-binding NtrC family response regulator